MQRGDQAEKEGRGHTEYDREHQDVRIQRQPDSWGEVSSEAPTEPPRGHETDDRPGYGEDQTLGKQLPDDPAPSGSQRASV